MVITDIKSQKTKDRVNIYLDGKFFSGALAETVLSKGIKVGQEIGEVELDELLVLSEGKYAFDKAIDYLSRRLHSEKEIRNKLKIKGYRPLVIDNTIAKLKEYGYLSDENFTAWVVECSGGKSKKEIEYSLQTKGISKELANKYLSLISTDDEKMNCENLAKKYMRGKEAEEKNLAKLYAYLSRKGYDGEVVKSTVTRFKKD